MTSSSNDPRAGAVVSGPPSASEPIPKARGRGGQRPLEPPTRLPGAHQRARSSKHAGSNFIVVDRVVEEAITHIRGIVAETVAKAAERVGAYILKAFYDDDAAAYGSKSPRKAASLDRLLAHCETRELPVSRTFISTAIRVVLVARALPATASFIRLPFSHRVELLKLSSPEAIEEVSLHALETGSTVRDIRAMVAGLATARKTPSAAPRALRAVQRIGASIHRAGEGLLHDDQLAELTDAERMVVKRELGRAAEAIARLETLVDKS